MSILCEIAFMDSENIAGCSFAKRRGERLAARFSGSCVTVSDQTDGFDAAPSGEAARSAVCLARRSRWDESGIVERASIPFGGRAKKKLRGLRKIFKIKRLSEGFDESVRARLTLAQETLGGDYVHFQGAFDDGMFQPSRECSFRGYEYSDIFAFFRDIGLIPFVRLDLSMAPRDDLGRPDPEKCLPRVKSLMDALSSEQPAGYWEKSLFEVMHFRPVDNTAFMECYAAIHKLLKAYSRRIGVGLHSIWSSSSRERDLFEERLIVCRVNSCEPDFATLSIDPSLEGGSYIFSLPSCRTLFAYGMSQIESVWNIINDSDAMVGDLYVTEWNMLPGPEMRQRHYHPALAFLRAAVMTRCLIEFSDRISGGVFWMDGSRELLTGSSKERGASFVET